LDEATRTTAYAASIKPFKRRKDERGALLALLEQYAGNDKWEAEIRSTRNDFMAAATHLLPYDPVAKNRLSGSKRGAGMISSALDIAGTNPYYRPGGY
jgi:hypothetical protein